MLGDDRHALLSERLAGRLPARAFTRCAFSR